MEEEYNPNMWGEAEVKILIDPRRSEGFLERGLKMYETLNESELRPLGSLRSKDPLLIALEPGGDFEPANHCNLYSLGGKITAIIPEKQEEEKARAKITSANFQKGQVSFELGDYTYRLVRSN